MDKKFLIGLLTGIVCTGLVVFGVFLYQYNKLNNIDYTKNGMGLIPSNETSVEINK